MLVKTHRRQSVTDRRLVGGRVPIIRRRGNLQSYAAEKLLPEEIEEVLAAMFPAVERERLAGYVAKFTRLFLQSIYKCRPGLKTPG